MSTHYLLPCACGKKTEIDAGQAGLNVRCDCGAQLAVPTMRGLSQLERVESPSAQGRGETQQSSWGARQGVIFLGAVILLGALFPVAYQLYYYPQRPQLFRTDFKELNAQEIEQATLPQTFELWRELKLGFEQQGEHPQMQMYIMMEKQAREKLIATGAVAAVGLLLIIVGLFIKPAIAG